MPYRFLQPLPPPDWVFTCLLQCSRCGEPGKGGKRCARQVCIGLPRCWQHTWAIDHVRVKDSGIPGAGKGLFADKPGGARDAVVFPKDATICEYHGERLTLDQLEARVPGETTAVYAVSQDDRVEDGACVRGLGTLANGSTSKRVTNAVIAIGRGGFFLRATKNIRQGQEILAWYGRQYDFSARHSTKRARG